SRRTSSTSSGAGRPVISPRPSTRPRSSTWTSARAQMPSRADQPIPGLEYQAAGRVAYLTINRPEKLNSLTAAMYRGLRTCVIRADLDDGVDIIVLRAAGDRAFCTGGDLVEGTGTWDEENGLAERLGELDGRFPFQAFERCSKTILTAVNGLAQAAGLIAV